MPKLKIDKSQAWWDRAVQKIPCGTQTLSKAPNQFAEGVYPIYLEKGKGSHVWDVDGNEFIDYPLSLGAMILGHQYPAVNEAIEAQLRKGVVFSLVHPLEVQLSELISEVVPCAEMVRFTKTGSEATQAAVRIARSYTGRKRIAACGYHGWHDWYVGVTARNNGVPDEVKELISTFDYNKIETLESLFAKFPGEIAAVIMEPVSLELPKEGFLEKVKELAKKYSAVLIFDEIITGFRFALGGVQELYGVIPDLATMGKAIANGMPLNLVCGKAELMKECDKIFFSSTFAGETLSLAAAFTTITEMRKEKVIPYIWKQGEKLLKSVNEHMKKLDLNAELTGFGPRQFIKFNDPLGQPSLLLKAIYWQECIKRGILFGNAQFISFSHTDSDINWTIEVAHEALDVVKRAVESGRPEEFYEGIMPAEIFRKV
jgi:glutamate-1-semialdehyde 2,1-aminomutase/spore coat polysaccharide biosynthesis protein SpsF